MLAFRSPLPPPQTLPSKFAFYRLYILWYCISDKIVAVTQEINSTLQRRRMQCQPAAVAVWLMDSVMEIEVHESDVCVSWAIYIYI